MNITKYGKTWHYGFGLCWQARGYFYFTQLVTVTARSNVVADVSESIKWMTPYSYPGLDSGHIYIVFDDETQKWYEYFTGISIDINLSPASYNSRGLFTDYTDPPYITYDVDKESFEHGPVDKVGIKAITATEITEMNADVFLNTISRFSEDDIKRHVNGMFIMQNSIPQWWQDFETTVKRVRETRDKREAEILITKRKIAEGFGKYSDGTK